MFIKLRVLSPSALQLLVAITALFVVLLAAQAFPSAVRLLFCSPAAWLSSQFLGVAMLSVVDGFRLGCPEMPIDVTLACSGVTFFGMLSALLLHRALPGAAAAAGSLLFAYLITLVANTARIVLGWHAAIWAHAVLPPSFYGGVHLAVGIIIFSGFMLAGFFAAHCFKGQLLNAEPRTSL